MAFRRTREALIVGGLLTLTALLVRSSSRAPGELGWVDRAVLWAAAPLESAITQGARGVGARWRHYVALVGVEADNRRLEKENERLRAEGERARWLDRRIGELERLLGLRAQVPSETLSARVIAVSASPYYRVVRIKLDRGTGEVKPGMPVLVAGGVVGVVRRVFGSYSDVLLATDPESSIDGLVVRSGATGSVRGTDGGRYRMRALRSDDVQEGDAVVTSGNDGLFPRHLPIGVVSRAERPEAGLWREIELRPAVDWRSIREVLVILAPPPPPDPEGKGDRRAPHRGIGTPR